MVKIKYSSISKKDGDKYNKLVYKIRCDMQKYGNLKEDTYIFAVDEESKNIVAFAGYSNKTDTKKEMNFNCVFKNYINDDSIIINMAKIASNLIKDTSDDIILYSYTWDTYEEFRKLGFEIYDYEAYNNSEIRRKAVLIQLNDHLKKMSTSNIEDNKKLKELIRLSNDFLCIFRINGKKIKDFIKVENYIDFDKLPRDLREIDETNLEDPIIYKTDDKYNYCETRDNDKAFNYLRMKMVGEIAVPNAIVNGGTICPLGLENSKYIIYLRDKENNEIVGYVGNQGQNK